MLDVVGLGRIDDVLAVELLNFVSVLVELGQAEDAPSALKRGGDFIEVGQVGLDYFDAFGLERFRGF